MNKFAWALIMMHILNIDNENYFMNEINKKIDDIKFDKNKITKEMKNNFKLNKKQKRKLK